MAGSSSGNFLNGKIFVYDWQGNRITREEITPASNVQFRGLFFLDDVLYQMRQRLQNVEFLPYTLQGVGQTSFSANPGNILEGGQGGFSGEIPTLAHPAIGVAYLSNRVYIPYESFHDRGNPTSWSAIAYPWTALTFDTTLFWHIPSVIYGDNSPPRGFCPRPGGFYMGDNTENIVYGLDATFSRESDDDITVDSAVNMTSLAWNGFNLAVIGSGGNVYLYGVELPTPAPTPEVSGRSQYEILGDFEERFDIVKIGEANAITEVVASNIQAIRQTNIEGVSVSSSVDIEAQLQNITLIPKIPIPEVERGDIVFLHTGEPDEEPAQIGAERWEVSGFDEVAGGLHQVIYCKMHT